MDKKRFHMSYGFMTGIAMILVGVILHIAGLSYEKWAQYVGMLVYLAGVLICCRAYAKANDNYVTFGQLFSAGFKASAIVTLLMVGWSLLMPYLFPEMLTKSLEIASERMAAQGMSDEKIDEYLEMTRKPSFKMVIAFSSLFMFLFLGVLFSLLGAAVNKKKGARTPFESA